MWRAVQRGAAAGTYALEPARPFAGVQSQRMTFERGEGAIGVDNRGLNRWGMSFRAGLPYEGYLWIRADAPAEVHVGAESGCGTQTTAAAVLKVHEPDWTRHDFTLTPATDATAARLAVTLTGPGSVILGHAFLQPGPWGRFHGLPTRRDVAEGLIRQ